jgi:IclR family pca regulon transcriptional regulator
MSAHSKITDGADTARSSRTASNFASSAVRGKPRSRQGAVQPQAKSVPVSLAKGPSWSGQSLRELRYSQSLERGLAILRAFTPERSVLGIADIADELRMHRSTTHRYVSTLVELGYLEQDPRSRKYRLGLRVTDLGMAALAATGLRELAHPHLQELGRGTGLTASIGVLDGRDVLYVDHVRSFSSRAGRIDLDLSVGSRLPAYCTAMGKVLLAYLPATARRKLIAETRLTKCAPNTITSKSALRRVCEEVRLAAFATSDREFAPERIAIAAPVRNEAREVAGAINLAAHQSTIRLDELVEDFRTRLVSIAEEISALLGYRRTDEPSGAAQRAMDSGGQDVSCRD